MINSRLFGYVRTVSLLAEEKVLSFKPYSFIPTKDIAGRNFKSILNHMHDSATNTDFKFLGSSGFNSDCSFHRCYPNKSIYQTTTGMSPEQYFYCNGKYPPVGLDLNAPDLTKPVTSIMEVVTIGCVSSFFPKSKINQSSLDISKNHAFNFSNQLRPDCKVDVLLTNGEKFTYYIDCKTMDFSSFQRRISLLSNNIHSFECNFYFIGGLTKIHKFSYAETQAIVKMMHNRSEILINTNNSEAINFVTDNQGFINKFSNTGLLSDLQRSQIGFFILSQENFSEWFSNLTNYP